MNKTMKKTSFILILFVFIIILNYIVEIDVEAIKGFFDTCTSTAATGNLDGWINHFA